MNTVGIKKTPARNAITQFLSESKAPVDVEQILGYLHSQNMNTNKVTVYRNIDSMFENGLVNRLEFGEGKYRYEIAKSHHHHLICSNCGRIEDVDGEYLSDLEEKIKENKGFLVKSHSLEFFGICKNCQSKTDLLVNSK
jgi:Fur family transcriptional regulator, ferric uptake regulator